MSGTRTQRRASEAASDPDFPALKARIISRTGHQYYADKDDLLFDRLVRRWRELRITGCAAYAQVLDGPGGTAEWDALEAEITIGETFFFRYAEQFVALKEQILPGLIAARANEKRLRIWSAGCSTGAEPYSIAILLRDLLDVALPEWDISIVGTDISAAAIATARQAEYGRWALRTMAAEDKARWFRASPPTPGPMREGGYRLRPEFVRMVTFERQNLLGLIDGSLSPAFAQFDLILCRNVLIYFSNTTVLGIVRGFGERLGPGGWLLIGHAEPNPAFAGWLTPVSLPGTVAYRRDEQPVAIIADRPASEPRSGATAPVVVESVALPPLAVIDLPEITSPEIASPEVLPAPNQSVPSQASSSDACANIRSLADAGDTGAAWRALSAALEVEPTEPRLRLYEGLLAIDLGREADAERALRAALYLDRDFIMAHYHLGLLLAARGREQGARRAFDNAVSLAQALLPQTVIAEGDGVTAAELITSIRQAAGPSA